MAACGGFEHIFEKPLMPLQSISPWKSINSVHHHSFTEIFGQLYSKGNNDHVLDSLQSPTSSSPSSTLSTNSGFPNDENTSSCIDQEKKQQHKRDESISSMNSESCASTCTELELGFESSDEDLVKNDHECNDEFQHQERICRTRHEDIYRCKPKRCSRREDRRAFPPPISCIGRNGKPWVCFKSFRKDGRFILTEIRIPTQEFLHACRENGRLRMQFIQSDDEFCPENEESDDENNYDDHAEVVIA